MKDVEINEEWRDIPEYEGIYQASKLGRIRSVDRPRRCKNNHIFICRGIVLKQCIQNNGYCLVWLRKDGRTKALCVHRLVASAFLPNPANLEQINHKDGNKKNNAVNNLEWCSRSENQKHAYRVLGRPRHLSAKVMCIETGEVFSSERNAERTKGLCKGTISQMINGYKKTAGGFTWKKI